MVADPLFATLDATVVSKLDTVPTLLMRLALLPLRPVALWLRSPPIRERQLPRLVADP